MITLLYCMLHIALGKEKLFLKQGVSTHPHFMCVVEGYNGNREIVLLKILHFKCSAFFL